MSDWSPSLPSGLARETPLDAEPSATGLPWEPSPPGSHVAGWRFYDARKFSFLSRFGPEDTKGMSQLQVRFRDKSGRLSNEYWYFFTNPDDGLKYLSDFRAAAHPGHVVGALKAAGVPYRKQGEF